MQGRCLTGREGRILTVPDGIALEFCDYGLVKLCKHRIQLCLSRIIAANLCAMIVAECHIPDQFRNHLPSKDRVGCSQGDCSNGGCKMCGKTCGSYKLIDKHFIKDKVGKVVVAHKFNLGFQSSTCTESETRL